MSRPGHSLLTPKRFERLPASHPPVLVVVIDTEEEFEWGGGFRRDRTAVEAMRDIPKLQAVFDAFGVRPTYVVDYPIATQEKGFRDLREFQESGRAVIGTHLHPWVNPPFGEELGSFNSYPGNLPRELEKEKLRVLTGRIEATFGRRPTVYKAGRYGIGPHTTSILEELGYEIDLSVCPGLDFRADGGPDFVSFPPEPYWFGSEGRMLLEIPCTAAFVGPLHPWGAALRRLSLTRLGRALRMKGILSRLRALDRLRVSPEGFDLDQQVACTRALLRRGVRVMNLTFHSPSATPGFTPFVRDEADQARFLGMLSGYLEFFLGEAGGIALTPPEFRDRLAGRTAPAATGARA
ncbi:MAG TPA: polysaccharide deacetylase family protein [Planctomycetota bacterium]|nr:polysaccharide deacetylase family protein [Planctomycetota bacterium]